MPAVVPIRRLRGTVLGLVGFGRIPQLVAPKARSFGIHVVACDPYVPPDVLDRAGVEVFASDGMTYVPMPVIPKPSDKSVEASAAGSPLKLWSLEVYELKSIWGN